MSEFPLARESAVEPKPPPGVSPDWHPEDIKAAIRKRGQTLTGLSEFHGYERTACRQAIRCPWPAVEAIIAAYIGRPPQAIWPSRYDFKGEPLSRQKHSAPRAQRHCRKRNAGRT